MADKLETRLRRRKRIRKKVLGTAERPRLTVFRSARHIYAQVVDDARGVTLAAASTLTDGVREQARSSKKADAAKLVGAAIARACSDQGVGQVVFDRNGYLYHGRVRALAEGAREAGLSF